MFRKTQARISWRVVQFYCKLDMRADPSSYREVPDPCNMV